MKNTNRGQTLIIVYMVIAFFLIASAALIGKSFTEKGIALRNRLATEAFYLAEGAIENAIQNFTYAIANYQISPSVDSYSVNTTFSTFGNATVTTNIVKLDNADRVITDNQTLIYIRNYEFTATAVHPQNNNVSVTIHQIIARRLIPTFQHAVFYNDDLEMLPGVDMTLTGRIHSNRDIYADSKATLTIESESLHSAGDIYNQRKDTASPDPGEVEILIKDSAPADYENMNGLDSDSPTWQTDATNRWGGTVQSAVHGVTSLTAPSVGSIQPGGYYNTNAGVVVTVDGSTNTAQVTKNGIPLSVGTDYPVGAVKVVSGNTFKNVRENQYVTLAEIDIGLFSNASGTATCGGTACANNLPANGLLYVTVVNSGANEAGVRLKNGALIKNAVGLTVVSNDPVYIQGNYNTGGNNSALEKPASVICDSLNLLSNNWSDANSARGLDYRVPTSTIYNAAFISGVDTTTLGNYNGGLENYPRLLEKWSNSTPLTIKGSFVELWDSSVAHGPWIYGAPYYTAPKRIWSYNTAFNDPSKLPPFTPWAVEAVRIAWWQS